MKNDRLRGMYASTWFAIGVLLTACAPVPTPVESGDARTPAETRSSTPSLDAGLTNLPATFAGDLPCEDCDALRYHLDVFDDGTYFLRTTYVGRSLSDIHEIGRWKLAPDGRTLELRGGREPYERFEIRDATTLHKLDLAGKPIQSQHNYDLKRQAAFEPIEPTLRLRGAYSYMADAGLFTECVTGKRLPVAQEADNAALESAYTQARPSAGMTLLATVDGRIAMRRPMEGPGPRPTPIVERFQGLSENYSCNESLPNASLKNTYWKLLRIRNQPVTDNQREPHLILHPDNKRVSGSGGCNQLMGSYSADGDQLTFSRPASTRMACLQGMEQEDVFLAALQNVARWRISGEQLELLDASGNAVAQFQARSTKTLVK